MFQWFKDFIKGLHIIFGKPQSGEGNRKLAKMSKIVMGQIPIYGKQVVLVQIIKSIEHDLKHDAKNGGEKKVNERLQEAIDTPEYMELLHRVGLDEYHLRAMAIKAVREYAD